MHRLYDIRSLVHPTPAQDNNDCSRPIFTNMFFFSLFISQRLLHVTPDLPEVQKSNRNISNVSDSILEMANRIFQIFRKNCYSYSHAYTRNNSISEITENNYAKMPKCQVCVIMKFNSSNI